MQCSLPICSHLDKRTLQKIKKTNVSWTPLEISDILTNNSNNRRIINKEIGMINVFILYLITLFDYIPSQILIAALMFHF